MFGRGRCEGKWALTLRHLTLYQQLLNRAIKYPMISRIFFHNNVDEEEGVIVWSRLLNTASEICITVHVNRRKSPYRTIASLNEPTEVLKKRKKREALKRSLFTLHKFMMLPYSQDLFMTFESGAKQCHVTLLVFIRLLRGGLLILSSIISNSDYCP